MNLPLLALVPGPLGIVALSVGFIVFAIAVLRLHAFFALMLAAALVALLTAAGQTGDQRFAKAIESVMTAFGSTTGKIGFAIALAAVIGVSLMESGAADKVVRRLIAVFGAGSGPVVLCGCSFILAAPVFVDTVFMLLLPIARALSLRTGRDYLLYVLAIGSGAVVANGVVPPAPGPLFVAHELKIQLGHAILGGIAFGILPALGGLFLSRHFNRKMPLTPRLLQGAQAEAVAAQTARPENELPGFWAAIAPVLLPIVLMAVAACLDLALKPLSVETRARVPAGAVEFIQFLGNKNVALFLGAVIALAVHARQKKIGWRRIGSLLGSPLETAGIIILIVSAGGAYGATIQNAGVGDAVRAMAGGQALNHVLLAWVITAVIRGAQGSATVATIAGVGIMTSIAGTAGYGVHPLYIMMAIGFGSKCLPWMNDAGFWVVSRMSGLTQGEMLRSWSPVLTVISILGLIEVLIVSSLFPHLPF